MTAEPTPVGGRVRISVVYALPDRQVLVDLEVAVGTTVEAAVAQSGLSRQFPDIAARPLACAIYGRAVAVTSEVRGGDRIEVLRPLLIDPKESRRQAAARSRAAGPGRAGQNRPRQLRPGSNRQD